MLAQLLWSVRLWRVSLHSRTARQLQCRAASAPLRGGFNHFLRYGTMSPKILGPLPESELRGQELQFLRSRSSLALVLVLVVSRLAASTPLDDVAASSLGNQVPLEAKFCHARCEVRTLHINRSVALCAGATEETARLWNSRVV